MKSNSIFFFFLSFVCLIFPFSVINCQVTVYPKIDKLPSSEIYSVNINGKTVWVEKFVSNLDLNNLPDWFSDPAVTQPQELHMANFDGKGKLTVKITVKETPRNVKIRPANLKIEPVINGKQIYFAWEGPGSGSGNECAPFLLLIQEGHAFLGDPCKVFWAGYSSSGIH